MQPILLIRQASTRRQLRRFVRSRQRPVSAGEEGKDETRIFTALIPGTDWGLRISRRAWERTEMLIREEGILFALAPYLERRDLSYRLYAVGVTLLDGEGVRQFLTIAAMERWFSLLGPETVAEMTACVEDAGTKWGPAWVSFLSRWVRSLTVTGPREVLELLQQEMLVRDGTVLAIGRPDAADIRVMLGMGDAGDARMLIDGRPAYTGAIPGAIRSGWPGIPIAEGDFDPLEGILLGLYHRCGHRFFADCVRTRRDASETLADSGVLLRGFLAGGTVLTFDRMRVQFYGEWRSLAEKRCVKYASARKKTDG